MKLEANLEDLILNISEIEKDIDTKVIKKGFRKAAVDGTEHIKNTISNFKNERGHQQGVDTGHFVASIDTDVIENGFGFEIFDGVPYGVRHEFGTVRRWLPFFDENENLTALGKWALRNFSEIGFFVPGKRVKRLKTPSRDQREEVLRKKKGINVKLDEMAPFRKCIVYLETHLPEVIKEEFDDL